jgi:hypothetical protein
VNICFVGEGREPPLKNKYTVYQFSPDQLLMHSQTLPSGVFPAGGGKSTHRVLSPSSGHELSRHASNSHKKKTFID